MSSSSEPVAVAGKTNQRVKLLKAGMTLCVCLPILGLLFSMSETAGFLTFGVCALIYIILGSVLFVKSPAEGRWMRLYWIVLAGSPVLGPVFFFIFAMFVWRAFGRFAP